MSAEPIQFPIIFRFDRRVVPSGPDMVGIWKLSYVAGNRFKMMESVKGPKARLHWLIDGNGQLRDVEVVGVEFEWLRPLRWLWCFTRTIYEIKPGRTVTAGELLTLNGGADRNLEKSSGGSLRAYLSKLPRDTIFTRQMFLDYMHESPDSVYPTYP